MLTRSGNELAISILFWSVAATPIFLVIQEIRNKNYVWSIIYAILSFIFIVLGFFWTELPGIISTFLRSSLGQFFAIGAIISALAYAYVRRKSFSPNEHPWISGFGEGIALIGFLALVVSPFLSEKTISEIFFENRLIFALSGFAGISLLLGDNLYRAKNRSTKLGSTSDTEQP